MMQQFYNKEQVTISIRKSEKGAILILFLFLFVALLFLAGLVIDTGNIYRSQLAAQKAADAATLSGMSVLVFNPNLLSSGGATAVEARGNQILRENLIIGGFPLPDTPSAEQTPEVTYSYAENDNPTNLDATVRASTNLFIMNHIPVLLGKTPFPNLKTTHGAAKSIREDANIVLMLDTSYSMACPETGECLCQTAFRGSVVCDNGRLIKLKNAAKLFVKLFDPTRDRIALIAFGTSAETLVPSNDHPSRGFVLADINAKIDALKAEGNTNICDALFRAYQDMADVIGAGEKVNYVLFSDGAPTSGRFLWDQSAIKNLTKPSVSSGLGDYDYQQFSIAYVNDLGDGYHAPSQLTEWNTLPRNYVPQKDITGTLNTTGQRIASCSVLANELSMPATAASMLTNFPSVVSQCFMDKAGVGDLVYHMPNIRGTGTAESYIYGKRDGLDGTSPSGMDIATRYGLEWAQLFYDCAVQTSDFLRDENGMLWVIGLGAPACIGTDPYQNIEDTLQRKDILLSRIAGDLNRARRDPYPDDVWDYFTKNGLCGYSSASTKPTANFPDFTKGGTKSFTNISGKQSSNGKPDGEYLSTTTANNLEELFRQIAIKIQLRLIK